MPTWSNMVRRTSSGTFYQDTYHYRNPAALRAHRFRAENPGFDQSMGFRRFHLRGLAKVKTEWGRVNLGHTTKLAVA